MSKLSAQARNAFASTEFSAAQPSSQCTRHSTVTMPRAFSRTSFFPWFPLERLNCGSIFVCGRLHFVTEQICIQSFESSAWRHLPGCQSLVPRWSQPTPQRRAGAVIMVVAGVGAVPRLSEGLRWAQRWPHHGTVTGTAIRHIPGTTAATVSSAAKWSGIRLMAIRSFAPAKFATDRKAARKSGCA